MCSNTSARIRHPCQQHVSLVKNVHFEGDQIQWSYDMNLALVVICMKFMKLAEMTTSGRSSNIRQNFTETTIMISSKIYESILEFIYESL